MKINVLVNEALRIMRNCSKHLPREDVNKHLQYFTQRMQFSGYPQEYRYEVMTRAFKIHEQPAPTTNDNNRRRSKTEKKRNWYDKDKFDGVMFVDVTENGELKKKVQAVCRKHQVKVKVVEKMNRTIKNTLQRSNPYDWKHCGRNDCPTCNLGIPINCRERGVCYEIDCKNCRITVMKLYRGQTERSTYERTKEHFDKWEAKADDSYLHKHSLECHNGEKFEVDVRIIAQCYGKPSTRLITEAVYIEELPKENSMNSKAEWTYIKLPRVEVV